MAHLHNTAGALGETGKLVGFIERSNQRLFDEQVNSGLHQLPRNREMVEGGNGNGGGLNLRMGRKQWLERNESSAAKFLCNPVPALEVGVNHSDQMYAESRFGQLLVDAGVIASECTNPDDCDVNEVVRGQVPLSSADCRKALI